MTSLNPNNLSFSHYSVQNSVQTTILQLHSEVMEDIHTPLKCSSKLPIRLNRMRELEFSNEIWELIQQINSVAEAAIFNFAYLEKAPAEVIDKDRSALREEVKNKKTVNLIQSALFALKEEFCFLSSNLSCQLFTSSLTVSNLKRSRLESFDSDLEEEEPAAKKRKLMNREKSAAEEFILKFEITDIFIKDLARLCSHSESADVIFKLNEKESLSAHFAILVAQLPDYAPILTEERKKQLKESHTNKIEVDLQQYQVSAAHFRDFLYFIYTGYISIQNANDVIQFYHLGCIFNREDLKALCHAHLQSHLFCVLPVMEALMENLPGGWEKLNECCHKLYFIYPKYVLSAPEFTELSEEHLIKLLLLDQKLSPLEKEDYVRMWLEAQSYSDDQLQQARLTLLQELNFSSLHDSAISKEEFSKRLEPLKLAPQQVKDYLKRWTTNEQEFIELKLNEILSKINLEPFSLLSISKNQMDILWENPKHAVINGFLDISQLQCLAESSNPNNSPSSLLKYIEIGGYVYSISVSLHKTARSSWDSGKESGIQTWYIRFDIIPRRVIDNTKDRHLLSDGDVKLYLHPLSDALKSEMEALIYIPKLYTNIDTLPFFAIDIMGQNSDYSNKKLAFSLHLKLGLGSKILKQISRSSLEQISLSFDRAKQCLDTFNQDLFKEITASPAVVQSITLSAQKVVESFTAVVKNYRQLIQPETRSYFLHYSEVQAGEFGSVYQCPTKLQKEPQEKQTYSLCKEALLRYASLFNDKASSDLVIKQGSNLLFVHDLYMQKIPELYKLKEEGEILWEKIPLHHQFDFQIVQKALSFAYSPNTFLSPEEAMPVYLFAKQIQFKFLEDLCCEQISTKFTPQECLKAFNFTPSAPFNRLKRLLFDRIILNIQGSSSIQNWMKNNYEIIGNLSAETIECLLSFCMLPNPRESEIFVLIDNWIDFQKQYSNRYESMESIKKERARLLKSCVNFSLLLEQEPQFFYTFVCPNHFVYGPLFTEEELTQIQLKKFDLSRGPYRYSQLLAKLEENEKASSLSMCPIQEGGLYPFDMLDTQSDTCHIQQLDRIALVSCKISAKGAPESKLPKVVNILGMPFNILLKKREAGIYAFFLEPVEKKDSYSFEVDASLEVYSTFPMGQNFLSCEFNQEELEKALNEKGAIQIGAGMPDLKQVLTFNWRGKQIEKMDI